MKAYSKLLAIGASVVMTQGAHAGLFDFFKGGDKKAATEETKKPDAPKEEAPKTAEAPKAPEAPKEADASKAEGSSDTADVKVDDKMVAAEFPNGDKLTIADVKATLNTLPPQLKDVPFTKLYEMLLRHAVDTKLISIEARKAGFDKKDDVKKAQDERKKALVLKTFLENEVKKTVTDADLENKYQELKKMVPENEQEYQVFHILVKEEAQAKKIIQDLRSGKRKFEDALSESVDKKTAAKGGELGWVGRLGMPPEMWAKVEKAKSNDIIDTPLNVGQLGYSILMVKDHRNVQIPAFADVKADLLKAMTPEFSIKVVKALKADLDVKIYGLDGKQIPEKSEEELRAALEKDAPSTVDASKLDDNMTCVEFKGGKVTLKEVKESVKTLPQPLQNLPVEKIYELLVIRLLNNKVIEAASEKAGLDKDEELTKRIALDSESVLQNAYLEEEAGKLVTNEDLRSHYDKVVKAIAAKGEMEYRLRHILVGNLEDAKKLVKRIKSGESFDSMVSQSLDEASKESKGELGYVRRGMLPKELGDAIAKTPVGTMISEPLNLNGKGFSIMRVEDKRAVEAPKFEQVKAELERAQKAEKAIKVVEKLRAEHTVKRFGLDGKQLSDTAAPSSAPVDLKTAAVS
jgi:peptidyl-prolyl cis-trans isomerase C